MKRIVPKMQIVMSFASQTESGSRAKRNHKINNNVTSNTIFAAASTKYIFRNAVITQPQSKASVVPLDKSGALTRPSLGSIMRREFGVVTSADARRAAADEAHLTIRRATANRGVVTQKVGVRGMGATGTGMRRATAALAR